jgi:protein-L-isoaspartate O-methyltransferase
MVLPARISGTEGYVEEVALLRNRYEEIAFTDVHESVLHLMPKAPCNVLDIGAGTGRDAAAFAELGNMVVAVEPVDELRTTARALHQSPLITWIRDSLPDLAVTSALNKQYELVMLTAVWTHLDAEQRRRAMPKVAALIREGGTMLMSLRYGPRPPNRRTFEVSAEETVELAQLQGLGCVLRRSSPSVGFLNRAAGVTWTRLAFEKTAGSASN